MKRVWLLWLLSTILILSGCTPLYVPQDASNTTTTDSGNVLSQYQSDTQVTLYLVAHGDDGFNGQQIGCADSLIPVTKQLNFSSSPVEDVLRLLFDTHSFDRDGLELTNHLYKAPVTITDVAISQWGKAIINLQWDLKLAGVCDNPRVEQQLVQTLLSLPQVTSVSIYINNITLNEYIYGEPEEEVKDQAQNTENEDQNENTDSFPPDKEGWEGGLADDTSPTNNTTTTEITSGTAIIKWYLVAETKLVPVRLDITCDQPKPGCNERTLYSIKATAYSNDRIFDGHLNDLATKQLGQLCTNAEGRLTYASTYPLDNESKVGRIQQFTLTQDLTDQLMASGPDDQLMIKLSRKWDTDTYYGTCFFSYYGIEILPQ